ncbi:hypothetical protein PG993_003901 [Apiospora rasikravindrae]|uniref:2EXR domain-containing protein n=1 Tax=Apiospora rasikravindrae TaxID=990691 RepID=A0ABR1U0U8_9PEZI
MAALAPTTLHDFERLPPEVRYKIYEEAMAEEHYTAVVPIVDSSKRVVLTRDLMRTSSKFMLVCKTARDAVFGIYDIRLLVQHNDLLGSLRLSSKWDVFLVGPWQFTLDLPLYGLFPTSISRIHPDQLAKITQVMEHQLLKDSKQVPVPRYDQTVYRSTKISFIKVDHTKPTTQSLAAQIGGGPYTDFDLLGYYTNPDVYNNLV